MQERIGVYAGSFNPFHKGHYNILLKAEELFDKVIIARGVNPEKKASEWKMPKKIHDRTIMPYKGLLTDFIKDELKPRYNNVTVIRGLRNSTDLQYEMVQYRYLQELMPYIQMISIFCDKEYEHISSSAIRTLEKYGKEHIDKYLLD